MNNLEFRALEIFKSHQFTADDAEALIEHIRNTKSVEICNVEKSRNYDININLSIKRVEIKLLQTSNSFRRWSFVILLFQTFVILALLKNI